MGDVVKFGGRGSNGDEELPELCVCQECDEKFFNAFRSGGFTYFKCAWCDAIHDSNMQLCEEYDDDEE